ncbi:MAG: alanine racemase, partial [Planctomycetota bacterium]
MTRIEVNLEAIRHNLSALKGRLAPQCSLMAVVKANAYGHGAIQVARAVLAAGASRLGVARIDEGIELRRAGVSAPILIFGPSAIPRTAELIEFGLTQTVCSLPYAQALSRETPSGADLTIHLKIDSGMGRLGLPALPTPHVVDSEGIATVDAIRAITTLPGLQAEGIFTHFASADQVDKTFAREQLGRFHALLDDLAEEGISFSLRHAANSAALLALEDSHLDMARAGVALYGLPPSAEVDTTALHLRPAMTLKT